MKKNYIELLEDISKDELFEGLLAYGLFSENLPPILTSKPFYEYCLKNPEVKTDEANAYIFYENIRSNNKPRALGIPNPFNYYTLINHLKNNWENILTYFRDKTKDDPYKISRIHLRKKKNTKSLFRMTYNNWILDDFPITKIQIPAKYLVKTDISSCFASIYTHSLGWSILGKDFVKENRKNKNYKEHWISDLELYTSNCTDGQTHGLLIGPHSSNLLAELILTDIDNILKKKYNYIRNIDDYSCYVESYEEAQQFQIDLQQELRKYNLSLNHKKTEIVELPQSINPSWIRKINGYNWINRKEISFKELKFFLDDIVEIARELNNAAVIKYAIKVISSKKLKKSSIEYYTDLVHYLVLNYPYLVTLLDEYIFKKFDIKKEEISSIANSIFQKGLKEANYELLCFAILFALDYNFLLKDLTADLAIESDSSFFKLFIYLYFSKFDNREEKKKLKAHALDLSKHYFNENWLFIYESLSKNDKALPDNFQKLKENTISFLEERYKNL